MNCGLTTEVRGQGEAVQTLKADGLVEASADTAVSTSRQGAGFTAMPTPVLQALAGDPTHQVSAGASVQTGGGATLIDVCGTGITSKTRWTVTREGIYQVSTGASIQTGGEYALIDVRGTGITSETWWTETREGICQVSTGASVQTGGGAAVVNMCGTGITSEIRRTVT